MSWERAQHIEYGLSFRKSHKMYTEKKRVKGNQSNVTNRYGQLDYG